ncbi:MAG: hypothetical protein ACTHN5_18020 [Phycisphaerae bacterium]
MSTVQHRADRLCALRSGKQRYARADRVEWLEKREFLSGAHGVGRTVQAAVSGGGVPDLSAYVNVGPSLTSAVSGAATKITSKMLILNYGNGTARGTTDLAFYARNLKTGEDLLLMRDTHVQLNLKPNGSVIMQFSFSVPRYIPSGTYRFKTVINESQAIFESNLRDNSEVSKYSMKIEHGFYNITGMFAGTDIPAVIYGGSPLDGNIRVAVKNAGNLVLPAGQQVNITVISHDSTNGAERTLAVRGLQDVSLLGAGQSKVFTIPIHRNPGLPGGKTAATAYGMDYRFEATITPVQQLVERTTADNHFTSEQAAKPFVVKAVYPDVSVAVGAVKLPVSVIPGSKTKYSGSVGVTIRSDWVALPVGQQLKLTIALTYWDYYYGFILKRIPLDSKLVSVSGLKAGGEIRLNWNFHFSTTGFPRGENSLMLYSDLVPYLYQLNWGNDQATVMSNLVVLPPHTG